MEIIGFPVEVWDEYDSAADWCAARNIKGEVGDTLPDSLGSDALGLIDADPEAFQQRVRNCAYARAMKGK